MSGLNKNRRAKKKQPVVKVSFYLPDAVLLHLASFLDPLSFLAFARTCRQHLLLARQLRPAFFAKPVSFLSLHEQVLHMVSLDLVRTENRALALTCRRLLPIARAHTWFNCGATDQRTVKLLDLLLRRGFDGTLLRHMSFDAMDAAKLDDPPCTINLLPSPRSFPTFATSPSSPSSLFPLQRTPLSRSSSSILSVRCATSSSSSSEGRWTLKTTRFTRTLLSSSTSFSPFSPISLPFEARRRPSGLQLGALYALASDLPLPCDRSPPQHPRPF